MASKALETSLRQTKRLLWEKYNKPGRNLYEALIAFEHNGVGQKVVCFTFPRHVLQTYLITRLN